MDRRVHVVLAGVIASWTALATGVGYAQPEPPRTAWGAPDLRGLWSHASAAPLERPSQQGDRELLTEEEVAEVNAAAQSTEGVGARRVVWWERPLSDGRTSLVVDPPNGRIPYTADARQQRENQPPPGADTPEERPLQERCITYGIPRLGGPYSQNIHVLQTPDHVLLLFEMIHEFRIIPLDDRPHLPPTVRQWLGDSRGHWENDTLVVETTNFNRHQRYRGLPLATTRLIERFTPSDTDTLLYDVTFEDSATWSRPWTTSLPMARTDGPMFEFACHEGNVGLTAVLEIARTTP